MIMDKNCCNSNLFIRILYLLLKMFILAIDSLKKAKAEPIIISGNKKYKQ